MGGMLIGTIIGVLVIPGLYFVFANLIKGRSLIKDEHDEPVSEEFFRKEEEGSTARETIARLNERLKDLLKRKKD